MIVHWVGMLRRHLAEVVADRDAHAHTEMPVTDDEKALAQIAEWGPAEDWLDWVDAPR